MKSWPRAEAFPRRLSAWLPPAVICLLALALRLWRLGDLNLWWDEALAVWLARKGLVGATLWTAADVHPPLYWWLIWAWTEVLGYSPVAVRSLSVVLGVLTVAAGYRLGGLLGGRRLAQLAALLIALARFHVWWSQEARIYALATLLVTLSLDLFLRWLRAEQAQTTPEPERRRLLLGYTAATMGALFTLYILGVVILVQNALVLGVLLHRQTRQRRKLLVKWVAAQLAMLVPFALWMAFSWSRMETWSVVARPFGWRLFLQLYASLLTVGVSSDVGRMSALALPPLTIGALGATLYLRRKRACGISRNALLGTLTLALTAVVPALAVYLSTIPRAALYTPAVEARYLLPYAPACWMLLAAAILEIGRHGRALGWLAVVLVLGQFIWALPGYYADRFYRDDLWTLARAVISQAQPGDALLLDSGGRYPDLHYEYDRAQPGLWRPPLLTITPEERPLTLTEVDGWMADNLPRYRRIWLAEVEVNLTDPERYVRRRLEEALPNVAQWPYGHNLLTLYDREGQPPALVASAYAPDHRVNAAVGADGLLYGWEMPLRRAAVGSILHLSLFWERAPAEPVAVTLRDVGGRAVLVRRAPPAPSRARLRQQFDVPLSADLPSGGYSLEIWPAPREGGRLATVRVASAAVLPPFVGIQAQVSARLGEAIVLEGYALQRLERAMPRGDEASQSVALDLYWRAEATPPADYTVFTHLLGAAYNPATRGPVWGQHDGPPAGGYWFTSAWLPGDLVLDRHILTLGAEAPDGDYTLEVGMYDPATGERLRVIDANGQPVGDHIVLSARLTLGSR